MTEKEKQAIEDIKNIVTDLEDTEQGAIISLQQEEIDSLKILAELIDKQQKEIEELYKVNKMIELYKSEGMPEDTEMVLMHKKDFLRNFEVISKDKIREIIEKYYPDVAIVKLQELLEE